VATRRRPARAPYHHGDLRRALLEAARAVLREQGPEGCSLREVARRAGVTHAAPYHHFPSREALLGALAIEAYAELDRAMAEAQAAAPAAPGAQLVAVGMGYLLHALRDPALFRLMTRPEHLAPPPEAPACGAAPGAAAEAASGEGPYGRLQRVLGALLGRPATPTDAHLCWATVHGLALLALDGGLGLPPGEVPGHARGVIERLVAGLAAAG
jgi:AcrR family transcriptional regulator